MQRHRCSAAALQKIIPPRITCHSVHTPDHELRTAQVKPFVHVSGLPVTAPESLRPSCRTANTGTYFFHRHDQVRCPQQPLGC